MTNDTSPSGRLAQRRLSKPLLSVEETAVLLGESRSSVYRSIERGDFPLPVFKLNGRLRVSRRAVERLMDGEYPVTTYVHGAGQSVTSAK
jgi:predicted DNA-binding transcriptional regulator AlpA